MNAYITVNDRYKDEKNILPIYKQSKKRTQYLTLILNWKNIARFFQSLAYIYPCMMMMYAYTASHIYEFNESFSYLNIPKNIF